MPVKFKDMSKKSKDLLSKGFDANSSVSVTAKASNGVKYTANIKSKGEKAVAGDVGAEFKHSSGFEVKKLAVSNDGKLSSDINLTGVVDNTTFGLSVVLLPLDLLADDGKGKEKAEVNVRHEHEKFSAGLTVSPVGPTSASLDLSVAAIDNVVIGGSYQGHLDDAWEHSEAQAAISYSTGDSAVALGASKLFQKFQLSGFHQHNADLAFAASVGLTREDPRKASISVGAAYNLDADTSVKAKLDVPSASTDDASLSLSFKQKINANVRLTAASKIDLDPNGDDLFGANLALGLELGAL